MSKLIQKSVRLPEELVEYIERQRGTCFSNKLVRFLEFSIRSADPAATRELSHKLDSLRRTLECSAADAAALALDLDLLVTSAQRVGVRPAPGVCQGDRGIPEPGAGVRQCTSPHSPPGEDMPRKPLDGLRTPDTSPQGSSSA